MVALVKDYRSVHESRQLTAILARRRSDTSGPSARPPRAADLESENSQDSKAKRSHRWRFAHPKVVRVSERRDVHDIGRNISRDSTTQTIRRFPIRRSPHRRNVQQAIGRWLRKRERWARHRLHAIPPVFLLYHGEQPQRAVEVEAAPGASEWKPSRAQSRRRYYLERHRSVACPPGPRGSLRPEY